jgi:hypothetical protein
MARKSGQNVSASIRAYREKNGDVGPKAIAEGLAKDGLKVTPAYVSTVLSNDRKKTGKRRRRKGAKAGGRPAGNASFESLVQAKRLADEMGGVEKARRALDALAKILG